VPVTNGEFVQELVKTALVKHPQLNKTGISGDQGDGHQPYGFAAKQLLNAEKGENVTPQKLAAIAKRLSELLGESFTAEDLVGSEEDETLDVQPAPLMNKTMIAKSKKNAPAVNAEEGATVSINIGLTAKD
jgi:hypothetical protein